MTLLDLSPRPAVDDQLVTLPVVVIGAGPVGLAAAAHLLDRGIDVVVLEAGERIASSIRLWGHTRLFSSWQHLIDPAARRLLEDAGWTPPGDLDRMPTGQELVDEYLEPLAALDPLASRIRLGTRATAVGKDGIDRTRTDGRHRVPFLVQIQDAGGESAQLRARAVIDASGTYETPNPLAASGLELRGGSSVADRVVHALPDVAGADRHLFAGRHTTVVGAGHSAANTLLALAELADQEPGTRITWMLRTPSATRVTASEADELPGRARLGARTDELVASGRIELIDSFRIARAEPTDGGIRLIGTRDGEPAEHETNLVVNATGFRPDLGMLREIRLELDEVVEAPRRLAPLIDPNVHSCGTVPPHGFAELQHPERGFFIVGMKSYGRAPTFLLATGYEQVRSIAAWLAGDLASASAVQLTLPATGVCSTDAAGSGSCC